MSIKHYVKLISWGKKCSVYENIKLLIILWHENLKNNCAN